MDKSCDPVSVKLIGQGYIFLWRGFKIFLNRAHHILEASTWELYLLHRCIYTLLFCKLGSFWPGICTAYFIMASEEPEDYSKLPLDVKVNHKVRLVCSSMWAVLNRGTCSMGPGEATRGGNQ